MRWPNSKLRRFVVTSFVGWSIFGLYMVINHQQPPPENTVLMPAWVPFWPAFLPVYLAMLLAAWLLPVAINDAGRFRACTRAYVCAYLLVMAAWIISPTVMPRPALPEGNWGFIFERVWAVDQPYNVRPCAHGIGPVIAAWFVGQERPRWRWVLAGMLVVGLASIALVWQHRPIDILIGTLAAVVGIAVAARLGQREQRPSASLYGIIRAN